MVVIIGIDIEKEIRWYFYLNLIKGLIIDLCGIIVIEEVCDIV